MHHSIRLLALLLLGSPLSAQAVLDLAPLRNVDWHGVEMTTPRVLAHALVGDFKYRSFAYPGAPLKGFLEGIRATATDIYHRNGFAAVEVKVRLADGKLRVDVVEGDRYRDGALRIRGNKALSDALLRSWLAGNEPSPVDGSELSAIWGTGEISQFQWAAEKAKGRVELAYRTEGRLGAQVKVSWSLAEGAEVELDIEIVDEGDLQTIQHVHVQGDDREAVIALIDLPAGTVWDTAAELKLRVRLMETGRYLDANWEVLPDGTLTIRLKKAPFVLELAATPLEKLEALKRGRKWLLDHLRSRRSVRVEIPLGDDEEWGSIKLDTNGYDLLARVDRLAESIVGMIDGSLQLILPGIGMVFRLSPHAMNQTVRLFLDRRDKDYTLVWGAGVSRNDAPHVDLRLSDRFLLAIASEENSRFEEGDFLANVRSMAIRINRASGQVKVLIPEGIEFLSEQSAEGVEAQADHWKSFDTLTLGPKLTRGELVKAILLTCKRSLGRSPSLAETERFVDAAATSGIPLKAVWASFLTTHQIETIALDNLMAALGGIGRNLGRCYLPGSWPESVLWHGLNLRSSPNKDVFDKTWMAFTQPFREQKAGPLAALFSVKAAALQGISTEWVRHFARYGIARLNFKFAWQDFMALVPDPAARDELVAATGALLQSLAANGADLGPLEATLARITKKSPEGTSTRAAARLLWNRYLHAPLRAHFEAIIK